MLTEEERKEAMIELLRPILLGFVAGGLGVLLGIAFALIGAL